MSKKKMRISDVYKLYQELRSVGAPEIRYLIMKDGQQIGGSPVYGFNGFYCLESSADSITTHKHSILAFQLDRVLLILLTQTSQLSLINFLPGVML